MEELEPYDDMLVSFSKEELKRPREPWQMTLMGKCLGIGMRPDFMAQRVRRIWNPNGGLEVIGVGHNVYFFKFSLLDDIEKTLFGSHYLMLTRWKPNFGASTNDFPNISVSIRLPELPIEYYEKEALFAIAKKVGKPIKVDYNTDKVTKGRFARVCIELSLVKPLVTKIKVGAASQRVEHENIGGIMFYLWENRALKRQVSNE